MRNNLLRGFGHSVVVCVCVGGGRGRVVRVGVKMYNSLETDIRRVKIL
jgi:hypothetical protein